MCSKSNAEIASSRFARSIKSSLSQKRADSGTNGVLVNLLQCTQRQCECATTILPGDRWLRTICSSSQESFDFPPQRFDVLDFQYFSAHAWPGAGPSRWRQVADRSMISHVVNRDIIAWLEETHLTNFLSTDPRCSDVRYRTCRKFQTSIGCIDSISQNRNADSMQPSHFDIFAHQPLHDVQIVNHQVEDDVDVQ